MGDFFAGVTGADLTAGSDGQWTAGTEGAHPSGQFFAPVANILDGDYGTAAGWGPDVVGGPTTYRRWVEVDLGEPRSLAEWAWAGDLDGTLRIYANDAPMPPIDPLRDYTGAPYPTPVSEGWTAIPGTDTDLGAGNHSFVPSSAPTPAFRYWAFLSESTTGGLGTSGEQIIEWTGTSAALAPPEPGPIVDVYDPDNVYLATIPAKDVRIRPELNDVGSGAFKINRYADEATAAILAKDNYVRVTIPQIDPAPIFGFFLDEGDFTLVSSDEKGGEDLAFAGHGQLSYWARARWLAESFLVEWWPGYLADPAPTDIGALAFEAGTYYRLFPSGTTSAKAGTTAGTYIASKTEFHTGGFTAYFDKQINVHPSSGSTTLVTIVRLSSGSRAGWWVNKFGAGKTRYNKTAHYAFGNSVLMESIDDGDKPGQVVRAMYDEAFAADRPIHPIPLMTVDFDSTTDSNGDPWDTTDALRAVSAELGDDYLSTIAKLIATGVLDVEMDVDLGMHAYNAPLGTDRSSATFAAGKVRFAKGVNIADQVVREMSDTLPGSFAEVLGPNDGDVGRATLAYSPPREISLRGDSSDPTALAALGLAELNRRLLHLDSVVFNAAVPRIGAEDELAGLYLPGPSWTARGSYWPGDYVTLDTGTGEEDFNQETLRLAAITIWWDDAGNLRAAPELVSIAGGLPDTSGSSGTGSTGVVSGGGSVTPASDLFQLREERDQAGGYPSLDLDGRVDFRELETSWKQSVRVAATTNVVVGTDLVDGGVVDGVTLAEGDDVLLTGQTADEENGVYSVPDSGSAARRPDLSVPGDFLGAVVLVREGTSAGFAYRTTNLTAPDVDVDAIGWERFGGTTDGGGMVPTYLAPAETFVIPANRQALFTVPIVLDVGAGITIGANAALVEVD